MVMRSLDAGTPTAARKPDNWSPYPALRREQSLLAGGGDSAGVIADMVSVLSNKQHGSMAEALAFLRQLYPRYPLTLRLAAIVAHSKAPAGSQLHFGLDRPVAQ
jgi:hypothetical protein